MDRASSSPAKEAMYKNVLSAALRAGYAVLADGGEAMDAAVAAVTVLEGARHQPEALYLALWHHILMHASQIALCSILERVPSST